MIQNKGPTGLMPRPAEPSKIPLHAMSLLANVILKQPLEKVCNKPLHFLNAIKAFFYTPYFIWNLLIYIYFMRQPLFHSHSWQH